MMPPWGAGRIALQAIVVIVLGAVAEWLFRRATVAQRRRLASIKISTTRDRLLALISRFSLGLGALAVFASITGSAFLLLSWPPVIREIVLQYLLAIVLLRLVLAVADALFVPAGDPPMVAAGLVRVLPINDTQARFWSIRSAAFVIWFAIGFATVDLLDSLGLPPPHRRLITYVLGLGLLAIALETVW